jgi:hypothetical protein
MAQKIWLAILLAMPAFVFGSDLAQDPRDTVPIIVKKHPSKWNYPTEITLQPGQKLHIVEKGNTFWALGRIYIGNPYLWPQIWEHNKWIADPHWIYPGDPIIVPAGGEAIGRQAAPESGIAELQPDKREIYHHDPRGTPVGYIYSHQDFLRLPYLAPKGAAAHFKELGAASVTGSQKEDRRYMSRGEVVYLDGGRAKGHQPGDRMMVLKVAKPRLEHRDDKRGWRTLGDVIQHAAIIRILSVHPKNSEAVIEDSMDGVEVGDHAAPFEEPALIPHANMALRNDTLEPVQINTSAKIVYSVNGAEHLGNGSMVLIDKGTKVGLHKGDTLICVRPKALVNIAPNDPRPTHNSPMTNRYLGQLLIVKTGEDYSTCLVVSTMSEMTLGDVVTN